MFKKPGTLDKKPRDRRKVWMLPNGMPLILHTRFGLNAGADFYQRQSSLPPWPQAVSPPIAELKNEDERKDAECETIIALPPKFQRSFSPPIPEDLLERVADHFKKEGENVDENAPPSIPHSKPALFQFWSKHLLVAKEAECPEVKHKKPETFVRCSSNVATSTYLSPIPYNKSALFQFWSKHSKQSTEAQHTEASRKKTGASINNSTSATVTVKSVLRRLSQRSCLSTLPYSAKGVDVFDDVPPTIMMPC